MGAMPLNTPGGHNRFEPFRDVFVGVASSYTPPLGTPTGLTISHSGRWFSPRKASPGMSFSEHLFRRVLQDVLRTPKRVRHSIVNTQQHLEAVRATQVLVDGINPVKTGLIQLA